MLGCLCGAQAQQATKPLFPGLKDIVGATQEKGEAIKASMAGRK